MRMVSENKRITELKNWSTLNLFSNFFWTLASCSCNVNYLPHSAAVSAFLQDFQPNLIPLSIPITSPQGHICKCLQFTGPKQRAFQCSHMFCCIIPGPLVFVNNESAHNELRCYQTTKLEKTKYSRLLHTHSAQTTVLPHHATMPSCWWRPWQSPNPENRKSSKT